MKRRSFLQYTATLTTTLAICPAAIAQSAPILRSIPSTGERLPAIGMGTWITFDVGTDPGARARRTEILRLFFDRGGALIDSSPMYGSAEAVVGHALSRLENDRNLFAATKVWTPGA